MRFHVEHIVSRQHGGTDDPSGPALACDRCNAYKGPNLTSIDPDTNTGRHCSIRVETPGAITLTPQRRHTDAGGGERG